MDEKELKKLLEKELDAMTPSMSSEVRKAPIKTKPEKGDKNTEAVDIFAKKRSFRPYVYGAIAAVLVIAIALAAILPAVFGGAGETPVPVYEAGYLRMDVNPSVEIVFDSENNVTAVKSANGDADVLLSDELRERVVGKPVDQAAAMIADEAGKLGYIEPGETNAVKVTVVTNSEKQGDEIISETTLAIENTFMEKGIFVAVLSVRESADWLAEQYGAAAGNLKEAVNGVAAKADSYFEQLAAENQSGLEALKNYYEKEVFEYLKDLLEAECANITRTRELLHQASDLNDRISGYNAVLFGDDYWATVASDDWKQDETLAALVNEMTGVLEKIEALRDDPVDNGADLVGLIVAYDWFIDEDWLKDIGNATLDDLKGSLDEIVSSLEELNIQITSAIRDAVAFVPATVEEFLNGTGNVVESIRSELEDVYLEYYNETRAEYSREDYDDFYLSITSEYGSLEAYWNSLR